MGPLTFGRYKLPWMPIAASVFFSSLSLIQEANKINNAHKKLAHWTVDVRVISQAREKNTKHTQIYSRFITQVYRWGLSTWSVKLKQLITKDLAEIMINCGTKRRGEKPQEIGIKAKPIDANDKKKQS